MSEQSSRISGHENDAAAQARQDRVLQKARERVAGRCCSQELPDKTLRWVHDSWVDECEAAGVYSRKAPTYCYSEEPAITLELTVAEVRLLAQRHLNTVLDANEFYAWSGRGDRETAERTMIHSSRFQIMMERLPPGEQQRVQQQLEIRQRYLQSVEAEVARCEEAEADFWRRANAGLLSAAEIAAHKTPSFIAGLPTMPPPADGGPGPEQWDMFSGED